MSYRISKVPAIASIVMLFLAVFGRWPYGFYTLLRIVVCVSATYLALQARRHMKTFWLWLMVGTALLFNPVVPVALRRSNWQPLDFIAAVVFAISLLTIRERKLNRETKTNLYR
jgi:hypothetical protein